MIQIPQNHPDPDLYYPTLNSPPETDDYFAIRVLCWGNLTSVGSYLSQLSSLVSPMISQVETKRLLDGRVDGRGMAGGTVERMVSSATHQTPR